MKPLKGKLTFIKMLIDFSQKKSVANVHLIPCNHLGNKATPVWFETFSKHINKLGIKYPCMNWMKIGNCMKAESKGDSRKMSSYFEIL